MVSGQRHPYVPAAAREATRAARCLRRATGLTVAVTGLVVVIAPQVTIKRQPDDVRVLRDHEAARWISKQPAALHQRDLEVLMHAARLRTTWQ